MSKIRLVILLVFIAFQSALAQKSHFPIPLRAILSDIEKQHQVHFNFLDEDIAKYEMQPPEKSLSLQEKLAYIEQNTPLVFDFADANSISISTVKKPEAAETVLSQQLQEVVISNYLTTGITKKTDGSYIVSPKKFGILPGLTEADVLQTMQQIPGIMSVDETVSNINVRGGTHDQNLFVWNGIRMFQTGHFFGQISAFNPSLPQEIKILKNGSPAFYGESVSSVVDISTKSGAVEKSEFGFGTNLISFDIYAKIKASEKASFVISARRSFTDLAETPTYKSYSDRVFQNTVITNLSSNQAVDYSHSEDFYFYDFTVQYQQKIGLKSELLADFIGISNALDVLQKKTDSDGVLSKNSSLDQQNYGGSLSWKTNWNTKNTTSINTYGSHFNLDAVNRSVESNQILAQQNSVFDTGFRLENKHIINQHFSVSDGYQFNETGITNYDNINNPAFSRKIKNVLRSHAFIVETQFNPNKKLVLKTGLRLNYFGKFNIFLAEPRLQFNYALTNELGIEVLGEFKSQTASQIIDLQQDFLGLEKRRWTLADNRENPIQKSRQISVGFTYKKNDWLLALDNFYKKVSGISSTSQSFQNQLEFEEMRGDYNVWGSELLVQKNFGHFYSWLAYSYNNNKYTFDNYTPKRFDSNFEIVQSISWAGIYEKNNLKFALGSKWYTGKPVTTPISNDTGSGIIVYNNPNNSRLSDYFQVNFLAFLKWQFNKKTTLQTGVSILNLFDKKNTINRYYRVNTTNNSIESVNTYSLRRTPNVSLKVSF
ncbi:MAG TPA: TonB-dependent receptor plug domain-containing protein [Flavobacterium sp.]|nr:TonB-dependent receptor plug domain-containing protein [Flavobacterium sp.]